MKKIKKKQEKRKIKKESKSLISETISGLSVMTNQLTGNRRENDDDNNDEEMDGLIRTTGGGGSGSTTRNKSNNTIVWKTLAFVLFAILILFATDVIEFKEATTSSSIHSGHNKNSSSSEIAMIDGTVEQKQKNPTVVVTNTEKTDTENKPELTEKSNDEAAAAAAAATATAKKAEEEAAAAAAKTKADEEANKKKVEEEAAAKKKAEEDAATKKKVEDDAAAKAKADDEAKKKVEDEAAAKLKADDEAKKKVEEESAAKLKAEEEAKKKVEEEAAAKKKSEEEAAAATAAATATAVDKSKTEVVSGVDTSRHTYKPRGRPMSDEDKKVMVEKWGSWILEDKKERPTEDYYSSYPNRDVPRAKFPANAWQIDKEWLSKFLPESISLVDRTINAILDEYGQPKDGSSELFHVEKHEAWIDKMEKEKCNSQIGCTTSASYENLKRRLLHAVMTEDRFVFAMGGHSSAAGHGNHFQQSYTLQVQWILEGVFSRLGVRHQSRNIGLGGLGTTQSGLATKSILGHDVDMLLWDSGMTEKEAKARDMFFRQGILGDGKVPMIMSMSPRNDVLALLNKNADADIFMVGDQSSLPQADTLEDVKKMPWAAQYVRCGTEISGICRENEYAGQCWIDRDDFTPKTKQNAAPGGRAKWHPGNRKHQLQGRAITFSILEALKEALTLWNEAKDYELADETWHVTPLYDNVRTKVANLKPDVGSCREYESQFSSFMCNTAIKARSEFTPRAYPDQSNIRTLMPPTQAEHINDPPESVYQPPDAFNENLHPPVGAVDVLSIIEAGVPYKSNLSPDYSHFYPKPKFEKNPTVPVGKGYYLHTYSGFCDGSVDSWCNKGSDQSCLLYNHNDGRNGLIMDSYCGWMVTNLPELKHGFIALKFESWHQPNANQKTKSWNSVNNERRELYEENDRTFLRSSADLKQGNSVSYHGKEERNLKAKVPDYCSDFRFEYSVDGKVTSLTKDEFVKRTGVIQRVVEVIKIVEDPSITGGEEKEIEFAFRITGCKNDGKTFSVTHIYWA